MCGLTEENHLFWTGIRRSDARWFKADSPFQIDFSFLSAQKKNTKSFDLVYGREQILPASMVNVSIDSFDL
jgi:hypothetical protein